MCDLPVHGLLCLVNRLLSSASMRKSSDAACAPAVEEWLQRRKTAVAKSDALRQQRDAAVAKLKRLEAELRAAEEEEALVDEDETVLSCVLASQVKETDT